MGRNAWAVVGLLAAISALVGCPSDSSSSGLEADCRRESDADDDGEDSIACGGLDCDDAAARRRPGGTEVCDADDLDEDCDLSTHGARDADADGYADANCKNVDADGETTSVGLDCDDTRPGVHPGLHEACNEVDDDCDGAVDEGVLVASYVDEDGDGYGTGRSQRKCAGEPGHSNRDGDCDDSRSQIHPGAFRCARDSEDGADIETCDDDASFSSGRCAGDGLCVPQPDRSGVCLPGASSTQCSDTIDNDDDGRIDWHDVQCISPLDDTEGVAKCADGDDDDDDGYVDFPNDPGCRSLEDNNEADPATAPACSNGLDDDADGFVDYAGGAGDLGCRAASDDSEREPSAASCDNGLDDDTSGEMDFPDDPSCSAPTDAEVPACDNGLDDDFDGLIDFAGGDPGCDTAADKGERGSFNSNYVCDNGVDDDQDGAFDFPADIGCKAPNSPNE